MKIDLYDEIIPARMKGKFEIKKVEKRTERNPEEYWIYLEEKEDNYPESLKKRRPEEIALNGFLDRLEILHSPFNNRLVYLQVYRRRWKLKGDKISHHNEYELHIKGMKCTEELGDFLKELTRQKRHKFFSDFPNIRYIGKENF